MTAEHETVKIVAFEFHNWDEGAHVSTPVWKNKTPGPTKNFLFDSSNIIYRIPEEQHQMSKKWNS